jgi:hypothetical protein
MQCFNVAFTRFLWLVPKYFYDNQEDDDQAKGKPYYTFVGGELRRKEARNEVRQDTSNSSKQNP